MPKSTEMRLRCSQISNVHIAQRFEEHNLQKKNRVEKFLDNPVCQLIRAVL